MIVIDRFEGDCAVCESGCETFCVARSSLPQNASEGDIIFPLENGSYAVDREATARRSASITSRFSALTARRRGQERKD